MCNTLQHTATHYNTLQHTATHCSTLQHHATHCNTLQHTATNCNTLQHSNTQQHTATHCNTLQHTATHYIQKYHECARLESIWRQLCCRSACAAVRHSVLHVAEHRRCVRLVSTMYCNVLLCVAMCHSVLQCLSGGTELCEHMRASVYA